MKAMLDRHVIAESDDIVESGGYQYFPNSSVHMEWLERAAKTQSDLACPHGVQFYDVVIDGSRHGRAGVKTTPGRQGFSCRSASMVLAPCPGARRTLPAAHGFPTASYYQLRLG